MPSGEAWDPAGELGRAEGWVLGGVLTPAATRALVRHNRPVSGEIAGAMCWRFSVAFQVVCGGVCDSATGALVKMPVGSAIIYWKKGVAGGSVITESSLSPCWAKAGAADGNDERRTGLTSR